MKLFKEVRSRLGSTAAEPGDRLEISLGEGRATLFVTCHEGGVEIMLGGLHEKQLVVVPVVGNVVDIAAVER